MECNQCASHNIKSFNGELAIHFPSLDGLAKPFAWVFPKLEVCLACGATSFNIPEEQLNLLHQSMSLPDAGAEDARGN